MIQPLRKTHRLIFFVLGVALPLLFIAGLVSRHAPLSAVGPVEDKLAQRNRGTKFVMNHSSSKFTVRLVENRKGGPEREFMAIPDSGFLAPDVFVYWSETNRGRPSARTQSSWASSNLASPIEFHVAPVATSFFTASRKTKYSAPFP